MAVVMFEYLILISMDFSILFLLFLLSLVTIEKMHYPDHISKRIKGESF